MWKSLTLLAAIVAAAAPARAEPPAWPSTHNWSGIYLGINGGFASVKGQTSNIDVLQPSGVPYATGPLPYGLEPDGPFGGLQIGANFQHGNLVLGLEADLQWADANDRSRTSYAPPNIFPFRYDANLEVSRFATVRGRLGLALARYSFYVTGGVAYADTNYDATYLIPQNNAFARLHGRDSLRGYVIGGGVEHALDQSWSLKVEYQYLDFGRSHVEGALFFANGVPSGETVRTSFDLDIHTVRIGLNYRFGAMSW